MATNFVFNNEYSLLICKTCQRSIPPTSASQEYHLRREPHLLKGEQLATLLEVFRGYGNINGPDFLLPPDNPVPAIPHLQTINVFLCCLCTGYGFTKHQKTLTTHIAVSHQCPSKKQEEGKHWRRAYAQTFYSEKKHIDYFEVILQPQDAPSATPSLQVQSFFDKLKQQRLQEKEAQDKALHKIDGFGVHKSEVVPWLERTGIAAHLQGIPIDRILAATQIPPSSVQDDHLRHHVLAATETVLDLAYKSALPGATAEMSFQTTLVMCQQTQQGTSPDANGQRFRAKKSTAALRANFRYWKQFLVYYLDTVFGSIEADEYWWPANDKPDTAVSPSKNYTPSEIEMDEWMRVMKACQEKPEDEVHSALCELLPSLFVSIICHETGSKAFSSALLSYAAMLAVKPTTKTWKEPGDFNSQLSSIIWVAQLLLFYHCARLATSDADEYGKPVKSTNHFVREIFGKFARQDCETPLGHLLNWRDLLFVVSRETMKVREAIWNDTQTALTYGDTVLEMRDVSTLLVNEYRKAYNVLYNDLLFRGNGLVQHKAHMFKDNMRDTAAGQSLLDYNTDWVPEFKLEAMIQQVPSLTKLFVDDKNGTLPRWNDKAIDNYEAVVQAFLQHLLVLIHIGSGQPLRAPELLSVKWKNTQNQSRSIFVLNSRVMLRVNYHKGLEVTGKTKDNMRFLPAPIGELLLDYLVYAQPLRNEFLRQSCPNQAMSPFLWTKDADVWQDTKVTTALQRACSLAEIPRLHVSNWRQMTVAIVKAKFAADIHCFTIDIGEESESVVNEDIESMNLQRNHSSMTANISYANQHSFGGLSDEFIQKSLRASQLWATFFQIESQLHIQPKRSRSLSESSDITTDLVKRIAGGRVKKKVVYKAKDLLAAAQKLYCNKSLQWRSPFQLQALETIMTWTETVIAILPTGAGKSLLFMLPCTLATSRTTIVVLPLVSLRGDMLRRLQEMAIRTSVWAPGERPETPLVLVSVEAACTADFRTYALSLIAAQKLDRIVLDECHLTVTASSYRRSMLQIGEIRNLATQFVYLTATLPPSMQSDFNERNFLTRPKIIRASADRPNIRYRLMRNPTKDTLLVAAARLIRDCFVEDVDKHSYGPEDKIIVYCVSIRAVDDLADLLCCPAYTSESGTAAEKDSIVASWLGNPTVPYIVATSALGAGLDYPHIRRVWHIDAPRSMIDFAQEAGRGGRDGKPAYSSVFIAQAWKPDDKSKTKGITPRRAMNQYLETTGCFRHSLSRYLDADKDQVLQCTERKNRCQNCVEQGRSGVPLDESSANAVETVTPDFTGARLIRQQAKKAELQLARFREDLIVLKGTCTLCRLRGRDFEHLFEECQYRFDCLKYKKERIAKGRWLKEYTACYWCLLPQTICQRAASHSRAPTYTQTECEFRDLVLPFCYAVYDADPSGEYLYTEHNALVENVTDFFNWMAEPKMFAGLPSINAVVFMAEQTLELALY